MEIKNKSKVKIGVVPTHLMFVGALAPDESGKLPRTRSGDLKIVSGMRLLCRTSPVKLNTVQVTLFPGTDAKDLQEMFKGLKALRPLNISCKSLASVPGKRVTCTVLSLTGDVRQSSRIPETIFRSPERVRGNLPDSSGASAPTNIRCVGTTPIFTLDLFLISMTI